MIISSCLCKQKGKSFFSQYLTYKNESVFKKFEGLIIAKCQNCGILKTFPPGKSNTFNSQQSRAQFYNLEREKFTKLFHPVINRVRKYLAKGAVLDVGCSSGILLSLLKNHGYKIQGIEPNQNAYRQARISLKRSVFQGTLKDYLNKNKTQFDCIIYNHVLEHIEDPVAEIKLIKKALVRDGILIIGTPNTDNLIFYLRQKYWEPLMPGEHLWHFSYQYLVNLFAKLGFKIIDRYFSDDARSDYPLIKRLYFKSLSLINKVFLTGEAVLIVFKPV